MNYPKNLKKGDTIGICAPSGGITKEVDIKKLEKPKVLEMNIEVEVQQESKGQKNLCNY